MGYQYLELCAGAQYLAKKTSNQLRLHVQYNYSEGIFLFE